MSRIKNTWLMIASLRLFTRLEVEAHLHPWVVFYCFLLWALVQMLPQSPRPLDPGVYSSHCSGRCAFVCPKSTSVEMECFSFILELVNRPKLTLFKTLIVVRLRLFQMFMQVEPEFLLSYSIVSLPLENLPCDNKSDHQDLNDAWLEATTLLMPFCMAKGDWISKDPWEVQRWDTDASILTWVSTCISDGRSLEVLEFKL